MANLLLVDDDHDLGLLVTALGKQAGHVVACCADAPAAWEALRRTLPDLLLLDVNLPDESGLRIVDRLCPPGSHVPAIVLTSTRDVRDLAPLLRRTRARGFIPKDELSGSRIEALAGEA